MAQLVTDAGADYIYQENKSNSSTPIGLETAYKLIQKADYWINVGTASTLDELKTVNPKFVDAKAVRFQNLITFRDFTEYFDAFFPAVC